MKEVQKLNEVLKSFKINATCLDFKVIDNYSFYDIRLGTSGKVKDLQKYADEISLQLRTPAKPSIKVLTQLGVVRLEFANAENKKMDLFDYFTNTDVPIGGLVCLLGQAVDGSPTWMDLAQNPHMIISGTTGSGKSVLLHNIIANLYNYNEVKLFLMDPKNIEFSNYDGKLRGATVSHSYDECMGVLNTLVCTMNERYEMLKAGEDITQLPYIVCIIDEFADLIMQDTDKQFYNSLCMLAQKSRAARIHLILATQRPSVNVINGTIKANFPARIACRVASHTDSRVVLDSVGAENLRGKGDALLKDNFRASARFQVAYTNAEEVCKYFGR